MRHPRLVLGGFIVAVGAIGLCLRVVSPTPPPRLAPPAETPRAPTLVQPRRPVGSSTPVRPRAMRGEPRRISDVEDPSVDPEVLKRAFAPPPVLPPQARPTAATIEPPRREWKRLQREDDAVAY